MEAVTNIKPGDIVRIKSLESIMQWERINGKSVPCGFTGKMIYLCGNEYVVDFIDSDNNFTIKGEHWWISPQMVECLVKEQVINIDKKLLMEFLEV